MRKRLLCSLVVALCVVCCCVGVSPVLASPTLVAVSCGSGSFVYSTYGPHNDGIRITGVTRNCAVTIKNVAALYIEFFDAYVDAANITVQNVVFTTNTAVGSGAASLKFPPLSNMGIIHILNLRRQFNVNPESYGQNLVSFSGVVNGVNHSIVITDNTFVVDQYFGSTNVATPRIASFQGALTNIQNLTVDNNYLGSKTDHGGTTYFGDISAAFVWFSGALLNMSSITVSNNFMRLEIANGESCVIAGVAFESSVRNSFAAVSVHNNTINSTSKLDCKNGFRLAMMFASDDFEGPSYELDGEFQGLVASPSLSIRDTVIRLGTVFLRSSGGMLELTAGAYFV